MNSAKVDALIQKLENGDHTVKVIDDLCGAASTGQPDLKELVTPNTTILACHKRSVQWLLHRAGVSAPELIDKKNILNDDLSELTGVLNVKTDKPVEASSKTDWQPWFPVIDYDRCIDCKQCASFCLFGVYSITTDGNVDVSYPQGCKNLCPACARICPEAAIIFPKLDEEPYNGAPITDETKLKQRIQTNVDQMLGDDIYTALAERRKKAKKRLFRADAMKQAEAERASCLQKATKDDE
ncbi:hypothetical protein KAR48_06390 [bacterium]|nr:hypothetical protein [bacterium]